MPNRPASKPVLRRAALILGGFALGAVVGGAVTAAAAARSARVVLGGAQLLIEHDESQLAAAAWNRGDMPGALAHATCALDVRYGGPAKRFDAADTWNLWGGAMTHAMIVAPNAESMRRVQLLDEAMARAKLAVVLERLGLGEAAQAELEFGTRLSGITGPRLHELGARLIALEPPSKQP